MPASVRERRMMWYPANPHSLNRIQEKRSLRGRKRQGEKKDENQVPGRAVNRVAFVGWSRGGIRTRSDAGGEGQGAAVSGNDKEECSGGDKRAVGSAVELQAGTGTLVGGAGDRTHRGSRGFYPQLAEGKGDDGAGRGAGPRREENRRGGASDGSRPHEQSAGAGAAGTHESLRVAGRLDQAFCGEPRDDGRLSENRAGSARSRGGQSAGKAGWV